jgi:hypothetical protein
MLFIVYSIISSWQLLVICVGGRVEGERRKSSETLMAQGLSNFSIAASYPGA